MRIGVFTGAFIVFLVAVLARGELIHKENRAVMRAYSSFSDAVEIALDDACEYLSLVAGEGMELTDSGAGYIERIYIEALSTALGNETAVFGNRLRGMTALFAVSDGTGKLFARNTRLGGAWKKIENPESPDDTAEELSKLISNGSTAPVAEEKRLFLPEKTGLIELKASGNIYAVVYMICRIGSGLTENKDFVCVRNAQIRSRQIP